jgi:alpha-L-rhamnosidase
MKKRVMCARAWRGLAVSGVLSIAACGAPGPAPEAAAKSDVADAKPTSELAIDSRASSAAPTSAPETQAQPPSSSPASQATSSSQGIAAGAPSSTTASVAQTTTSAPAAAQTTTSAPAAAQAESSRPHPLAPKNLRVEYLKNPLSIDERKPRFSWEVDDPRRGAVQSAYRIRLVENFAALSEQSSAPWDTGKVMSSETNQIEYAGAPLEALHDYFWEVRTFDAAGEPSPWSEPASFGMGPLAESDWRAEWIGDATFATPAIPGRNGYHSQFSEKEDDYKWVQIDLGQDRIFDGFRMFPTRPFDWQPDTPGYLFPVRFKAWVSSDPNFTDNFQLIKDESFFDVKNPITNPYEFHVQNTRFKMRYLRIGVFKMAKVDVRGYAFTLAELQVLNGDQVVSNGAKVTASDSLEKAEWSTSYLTDGEIASHGPDGQDALPARLLRKDFKLDAPAKRAVLRASALGMYQVFINGKRIGDDALDPGWTDYDKRVNYQTFDATSALRAGDNTIGAILGDGWYSGRIGLASDMAGFPVRGIYARKPRLLAELDVELENGQKVTIASDPTWHGTMLGPVRNSDLLDGETYDARSEKDGWSSPGFYENNWEPVEVGSDSRPVLVAQPCETIRVVQELKPVKLTEPRPGSWVYDMGQNMVGWCRFKIRGPVNSLVTLRHAEVLDQDGTLYMSNLRRAPQTDYYALRGGGDEFFEPHFTYHGFRYVEVTGLVAPPELGDLTCKVVSTAAREVGRFECSNPTLNKLWQNIRWTLRGNLMSIPTDCPQRDERLGWMGDMNAFAQTAIFQMDLAAFFTKWLQDVRDAQPKDGRFPDFAPHPYGPDRVFTGTPAWGDAGVKVPWLAYVNYGDKRLLEKSFESVTRWIEHIRSKNPNNLWINERGNDYGDWLNGDWLNNLNWPKRGATVPKEVLATAFFAHSTETASKMAAALGRKEDTQRLKVLFESIKAAFDKEFVTPEGVVRGDTQAGYALALGFDLLPAKIQPNAMAHFSVDITEKHDGHLTTGFQTTGLAMDELARRGKGYVELASRLARDKSFPSWGYMIDQGATTIWERRDGYVNGRGFQDPSMNSFNHYAFGSVGDYMMRWIGGIQPDESAPGYAHFLVRPRGGIQIQHARVEYDSIRGKIASAWRLDGEKLHLDVTIPANTSASVYLPTQEYESVKVDGRPVADAGPDVLLIDLKDGEALLDVRAGTYAFECKRPPQ